MENVHDNLPEGHGRNFSVEGRVVIVTGAGQGIGRAYAREFAAAGATTIVADINFEAATRVVEEVKAAGGRGLAIKLDVGDEASVNAMAERTIAEFGRIDVLINNAALFSTLDLRGFEHIPLDEWDRVVRVNTTGCFLTARAVAPAMRKAQWGRIINITSGTVTAGAPNYLHYVTTKSSLVGMTNSLARELGGDNITVNAVEPGGVFTEVPRASLNEANKAWLLGAQCIHRAAVPGDLVGLLIFLSSPAAGFITGQTIACDGGLHHR